MLGTSSKNIHLSLLDYPIPIEPTRFPKETNPPISKIHDIIVSNLTLLIPNNNLGLDNEIMIEWISKTKEYGNQLNAEFQRICDRRIDKIRRIEVHDEKSRTFDISKLDNLPEDIVRYIHEFLMPETRKKLFLARYPRLFQNICKLKVSMLKKLLLHTRQHFYWKVINSKKSKFLPIEFQMSFSYVNKRHCIEQIQNIIYCFENANTSKPSNSRYFQRKGLRFIKMLVYVGKRLGVLERPFAPELDNQPNHATISR